MFQLFEKIHFYSVLSENGEGSMTPDARHRVQAKRYGWLARPDAKHG
jgi:hypothetical protein